MVQPVPRHHPVCRIVQRDPDVDAPPQRGRHHRQGLVHRRCQHPRGHPPGRHRGLQGGFRRTGAHRCPAGLHGHGLQPRAVHRHRHPDDRRPASSGAIEHHHPAKAGDYLPGGPAGDGFLFLRCHVPRTGHRGCPGCHPAGGTTQPGRPNRQFCQRLRL